MAVLQAGEHSRPARRPIAAYINWAAYDELSDNVELTEQLALQQLGEVVRLRRAGVRIDYYLNDCFWFAKDGGYRRFRTPHWPKGPDAWLEACRRNGLLPGLWIGTNTLSGLTPIPEWEDSLNRQRNALCLFEGGFLPHLIGSLQHWYDRGVRMYKFDFANFAAATPAAEKKYAPEEIVRRNMDAFRNALFAFREKNPEAVLIAYNGFGADMKGTAAPFRKSVDLRWLDVFDSLYSGDPRPADVPAMNFWRSKDIYSDHMVRRFRAGQLPAGTHRQQRLHDRYHRHLLQPAHQRMERHAAAFPGPGRLGKHLLRKPRTAERKRRGMVCEGAAHVPPACRNWGGCALSAESREKENRTASSRPGRPAHYMPW